MHVRSYGEIFLGATIFSLAFFIFSDYWTIYKKEKIKSGPQQRRMEHIPSFKHFAFSNSSLKVPESGYLSDEVGLLNDQRAHNDNDTSIVWGYATQTAYGEQTLRNELVFTNGIISSANVLCACGRCFTVILQCCATGHFFVDIKASNNSSLIKESVSKKKDEYSDISYFFMRIKGSREIWSTFISDQDKSLKKLDPIRVSSSGKYNVSLTLIYTNKSSAYGLEKYQRKELHCVLCRINGTCHTTLQVNVTDGNERSGWVPITVDDIHINKPILSENDWTSYYFRSLKNDGTFFTCPACKGSHLLDNCLMRKKFMYLGDSHMRQIWKVLQKDIRRIKKKLPVYWKMREDGHGIYHNLSPDKNFKAYKQREVPPVFVPGDMIKGLQSDLYEKLQQNNKFDAWIFSSGHWDLRDTSIDEYMSHLEELFQMWSEFRRKTGVWLVWNGVPPYSYNRDLWGGLERRTNIKIALADHETKHLCKRYNITYIPYFDIALPFYYKSCDTHHYLCEGKISPIGSVQLNLLLRTICTDI